MTVVAGWRLSVTLAVRVRFDLWETLMHPAVVHRIRMSCLRCMCRSEFSSRSPSWHMESCHRRNNHGDWRGPAPLNILGWSPPTFDNDPKVTNQMPCQNLPYLIRQIRHSLSFLLRSKRLAKTGEAPPGPAWGAYSAPQTP